MSIYSIGNYSLEGYRKIKTRGGDGFTVYLYHLGDNIATVQDEGIGLTVNYNDEDGYDPESCQFIQRDMEDFLSTISEITEPNARWEKFKLSPTNAIKGFTEILLDLKELVKVANKAKKETPPDSYYIAGSMGNTLFKRTKDVYGTTFFYLNPKTPNYEEAKAKLVDYSNKTKNAYGDLASAAILRGNMEWDLTYEDYLELYKA